MPRNLSENSTNVAKKQPKTSTIRFFCYVFKKFGMKLGACSTEMLRLGYDVEINEALAGDLIFFRRGKDLKAVFCTSAS